MIILSTPTIRKLIVNLGYMLMIIYAINAYAKVAQPWSDLQYQHDNSEHSIQVTEGRFLTFNYASMNDYLVNSLSNNPTIAIKIPLPNGSDATYQLTVNNTMSPVLANKFPTIQSFFGHELSNSDNRGSFNLTPSGFYGYFKHNGQWIMLDPLGASKSPIHVSYYKKHAQPRSVKYNEIVKPNPNLYQRPNNKVPVTGTEFRTYRLAVSATGEYTEFHSSRNGNASNTTDAMAAISVLVNRINEVYRRDLSIAFSIIDNNELLIYTDPATDPFGDDHVVFDVMLNNITINDMIGVANYDIGHLVSTRNAAIAAPGVCEEDYKAQALSGSSDPIGDAFFIDFVAHELGHQLGANHTFNGTTEGCGGNRVATTAWEPGSGSTILGYAGLCGGEDLQPLADATFHIGSIEEIVSFTQQPQYTCGTTTNPNNNIPVANAGIDVIVPANTPMLLSAVASDTDSDSLVYSWEQLDLGHASNNRAQISRDDGTRPLFRSFAPTPMPQRYLPRLEDIIAGTTILGETLPTTSRTLTFRFTVKDGSGGVASDERIIRTTTDAGPFIVTEPTAAIEWQNASSATINWNVANTDQAPIACSAVDILLSTDSGVNFNRYIVQNTANNGSYSFTPSIDATTTARVMVLCSNNLFFNINSGDFSIGGQNSGESLASVPEFGLLPLSSSPSPSPSPAPAPTPTPTPTPPPTSDGSGSIATVTLLMLLGVLILSGCSNPSTVVESRQPDTTSKRSSKVQSDIDALSWVIDADIDSNIRRALDSNNLRLLAFANRAVTLPAIDSSQIERVKSLCGIDYVKGIGDIYHQDAKYRELRKLMTSYVKQYNNIMLEHCMKNR